MIETVKSRVAIIGTGNIGTDLCYRLIRDKRFEVVALVGRRSDSPGLDMFKDDASDPLSYFRDISTFGGCASGPAAALENMRIIEDEGLLDNTLRMGARLMDNLAALQDKHAVIGQVRGKGLFCGAELVADRVTKEAADEKKVAAVVADCMAQGVIIGMTNRSLPGLNNTLCLSPALIATPDDIDHITDAIDGALGRVFG